MNTLLQAISSSALLNELVTRGVIQLYGVEVYVPGVVFARQPLGDGGYAAYMRARLLQELTRGLAGHGVVAFEETPATDKDKNAPPNDRIHRASIMILDPKADLS